MNDTQTVNHTDCDKKNTVFHGFKLVWSSKNFGAARIRPILGVRVSVN